MSLYNMVHGYNEMAPVLLAILRLKPGEVPRFRDCWWDGEHIVLYTRTGGANRAFYESPESWRENYADHDMEECKGPWNSDLRKLPTYVRDEDCDFDSTFAKFYFDVPENLRWAIPQFTVQNKSPRERMEEFLRKTPDDPQAQRVTKALEPLLRQIANHEKD